MTRDDKAAGVAADRFMADIHDQPRAILAAFAALDAAHRRTLESFGAAIADGRIRHVLLTGMGGSLHGAYGSWQRLAAALPVPVSLWDASELIQQAPGLIRPDTLVIAISQSGESIELQRLTQLPARPFAAIAITNGVRNTLSAWADCAIATRAGPEDAVSTKTYLAGLVALHALECAVLGQGEGLGAAIEALAQNVAASLPRLERLAPEVLAFLGHDHPLAFIGRGASYASAGMAALMTAEAAKLTALALTGGQFRHGPLELVREGFRAVIFLGDGPGRALNAVTAQDIARFGGRCLVVAADPPAGLAGPGIEVLEIPAAPPALLPVLEIVPLQLLMVPLALARGVQPAQFVNGTKVTLVE